MSDSECQACSLRQLSCFLVLYLQGSRKAVVCRQVESCLSVDVAGVDISPQGQQVLHDLGLVCCHSHEQGSLRGHTRSNSEN